MFLFQDGQVMRETFEIARFLDEGVLSWLASYEGFQNSWHAFRRDSTGPQK